MKLNLKQLDYKCYIGIAVIGIALIFGVIYILRAPKSAEAEWFNDSWYYRQSISITNSSTAQTDFQVQILDDEDLSSLVSAGKLQSNLADLRFTDFKGNLLDYWIEDDTNVAVNVWIKVPSIPTTGATIYMYYGNASASDASDATKIIGNSGNPGTSCTDIKNNRDAATGVYYITGTSSEFQAYCDMDTENGGWTLIMNRRGGYGNIESCGNNLNEFLHDTCGSVSSIGFADSYSMDVDLRPDGDEYLFYNMNISDVIDTDDAFIIHSSADIFPDSIGSTDNIAVTSVCDYSNSNCDTTDVYWKYDGNGFFSGANCINGHSSGYGGNYGYCQNGIVSYSCNGLFGSRSAYNEAGLWNYTEIGRRRSFVRSAEPLAVSLSSASPSSEEKGPGPVAYWSFNEGYGTTAYDGTSNSNDGTITSATWQTEDQCIAGKCLDFDGINNKVTISTVNNIQFDQPHTFSAWFTYRGFQGGFSGGKGGLFRTTGGARIYTADNSSNALCLQKTVSICTGNLNDNQWYYYTYTWDGTTAKIYIDGVQVNSGAITLTAITNLTIGYTQWWHKGMIDEVKIYPYARTATQIKTDYNAGLAGVSSASGVSVVMGGQSNKYLSDGLVAYWKMDEASWSGVADEVIDASGNGNHGVRGGSATTANGKFGNGGSFDGSGDYILIAGTSDFDVQDFTLSSWNYSDNYDANMFMFEKTTEGSVNTQYSLFYNSGGTDSKIYFRTYGLSTTELTVADHANGPVDGQWNHIVATYNSSTGIKKIYCNGVEIASQTGLTGTINTNPTGTSWIGTYGGGSGYPFNGKKDEVRIYNRALSAREVRQLYEWAPGPVGYWNFEENGGTTAYDKSGNENNGTLTNMDADTDWVLGKYGGGLDFDGDDSYVSLSSQVSFADNESWSINLWIKGDDLETGASNQFLFNADNDDHISYYQQNRIVWYGNNGTYSSVDWNGNYTFLNDTWYNLNLICNGISIDLYVNGNYISTKTPSDNNTSFVIDYVSDDAETYSFDGLMDEVRIYDYARTQKQILEDMNGGRPASKSPVGYWKFDEGYGDDINDSSGNDYTCTKYNALWNNDGKFGKSLTYDGNGDYVSCGNTVSQTSERTYSWWQKVGAIGTANYPSPISYGGYSTGFRVLYRDDSDDTTDVQVTCGTDTTPTFTLDGTGVDAVGVWHHYVFTYDGAIGVLYRDGILMDTETTVEGDIKATTGNFYVGQGQFYFNGDIDEVKSFSYAMTKEEVIKEYNQGKAVVMGSQRNSDSTWDDGGFGGAAPLYWFNMEEGTGTAIYSKGSSQITSSAWDGTPTWALGNPGWSLSFDGSSDGVYLPGISTYAHETLTAWVYIDSSETNGDIVGNCHTNSNAYGFTFYIDNNTLRAKAEQNGDTYFYTNVTADITNLKNQWIHLGMSWDNLGTGTGGCDATVKLYVNGSMVDSATDNVNAGSYNCTYPYPYPFSIGGTTETSLIRSTKVKVDDVKVYNYVRTSAQIAYDYNGGKPVGWWTLDDGEGINANDISGNDNDGTLTTMDPATDWLDGTDCKFEGCLDFDGSGDYVVVSDPASGVLDFGTNDFSVATWVYSDGYANSGSVWNALFSKGTLVGSPAPFYGLFINSTNNVYFMVNDDGYYANSTFAINGAWHHVVGVREGDNLELYIDGDLNDSGSTTGSVSSGSGFYMGEDDGNTNRYFDGKLDDVRIYNYALAPSQIKELYNGGLIRFK